MPINWMWVETLDWNEMTEVVKTDFVGLKIGKTSYVLGNCQGTIFHKCEP